MNKTIIQNISRDDVKNENFNKEIFNKNIIQIESIHGSEFLELNFDNSLQLRFDDIEFTDDKIDYQITGKQMIDIIDFLNKHKLENILVHCTVGQSRSGAIVQFAIDCMGFVSLNADRIPNRVVLRKLKECYAKM